jgi:hypothetical protein
MNSREKHLLAATKSSTGQDNGVATKTRRPFVCSLPGHPFVVNQGQGIGANNIAIALFSFPSLATYEEYHIKISEDED